MASTHRDYVIDRRKKLRKMFAELQQTSSLVDTFHTDPRPFAAKFGIDLNEEEIFGIQSLRGVDLRDLHERLVYSPMAVFDQNCSCPGH